MYQKVNNNKNSSNSLAFGQWPQTKMTRRRTAHQSCFEQFCDSKQRRLPVAGGQLHALVGQVAEGFYQVLHGGVAQVAGRFEKSRKKGLD